MAYDVFLSYARIDTDRARQIKDLLEGLGLSVFFDTEGLDGGDVFPDVLDEAVKTSGAVVGVWSKHALSRPWVKIECDIGKTRGVLVPLQIEQIADLDRPAAFWNIQFADLSDFRGDANHTGWLRFLRSLARTLDRPDLLERESAAQAATPDSQDASVRDELAALRTEMADMRSAKERAAASPLPPVTDTATNLALWQEIKATSNLVAMRRFLETVRGTALENVVDTHIEAIGDRTEAEARAVIHRAMETGSRVEIPQRRRASPLLIPIVLLVIVLIAGYFGWQYWQATQENQTAATPASTSPAVVDTPVALPESNGVAYHVQACENGITTGCMSAATAYAYGEGVELDRSLALGYYDRGCDLGDFEACWVAGITYEQDGEYRVARALYDRACLGGFEDGCGLLEDLDKMVAVDSRPPPTKPSWALGLTDPEVIELAESCMDGSMTNCNYLGIRYKMGWGVAKDYVEVKRLYAKACNGGEMAGCSNLAYMYQQGEGVVKNYSEAKLLYTTACNGGNQTACEQLETLPD